MVCIIMSPWGDHEISPLPNGGGGVAKSQALFLGGIAKYTG